jgi:hypothetical protein
MTAIQRAARRLQKLQRTTALMPSNMHVEGSGMVDGRLTGILGIGGQGVSVGQSSGGGTAPGGKSSGDIVK